MRHRNSIKTFFFIAFPITITMYFPMFGKIVPFAVSTFPHNFCKYSAVFITLFICLTLLLNGRWQTIENSIFKLLFLNIYLITTILIKGLLENQFQTSVNLSIGVILSTLLIIFLCQQKEFHSSEQLFEVISTCLAVMLILQLIVSMLESYHGTPFGIYEVNIIHTLYGRDLLEIFNTSQTKLFGFKIPFTGLIGQHNRFGIMLVFYNIYFLSRYEITLKKYYLLPVLVVLIALIGNSTRSAILITLVTNTFFIIYKTQKKKQKKIYYTGIFLMILSVIIAYMPDIINHLLNFYYQTNSLETRLIFWKLVIKQYLVPNNLIDFIFGLGIKEYTEVGINTLGRIASVENEFIKIYLLYGFLGLVLFISVFSKYYVEKSLCTDRKNIITDKLLFLNMIFICIFMEGIMHYATYMLITLTILGFVQTKTILEKHRKNNYNKRSYIEIQKWTQVNL
jgi:O-Antigen ligase